MYYTYILKCKEGRLYVGCTSDLASRMIRHKNGNIDATKNRLPIVLHSYLAFSDKHTAFNFEKYLKSGSGRSFIKKHFI